MGFCWGGEGCGRRTVEFVNGVERIDPSIEIVAVGCDFDPEWNFNMVRVAGEYIDCLPIHTCAFTERWGRAYEEPVAWPVAIEWNLRAIYRTAEAARRRYGAKHWIELAFDEWSVRHPEAQPPLFSQPTRARDAVLAGLVLNALRRLCRAVPVACFAQTVNVLPLILADDEGRVVLTPQ